jgi:hypothetical protein
MISAYVTHRILHHSLKHITSSYYGSVDQKQHGTSSKLKQISYEREKLQHTAGHSNEEICGPNI